MKWALEDILYYPDLWYNLKSVSRMQKGGKMVIFDKEGFNKFNRRINTLNSVAHSLQTSKTSSKLHQLFEHEKKWFKRNKQMSKYCDKICQMMPKYNYCGACIKDKTFNTLSFQRYVNRPINN